jgi:hypothetical protein
VPPKCSDPHRRARHGQLFDYGRVEDTDVLAIWLDLLNDLRTVSDDHHRGLVWPYVPLRDTLNLLDGYGLHTVPIGLQMIIRQIKHFDLHQLIDQPFLRFQTKGKHPRQV